MFLTFSGALGMFKDSVEAVSNAIDYLDRYAAPPAVSRVVDEVDNS
jgi:hypothetical protein